MGIAILFETSDLVVINKPSGLVVHGDGKHSEPTVVDWFVQHYPESQYVGEKMTVEHAGEILTIPRSGVVHRLDRDTSGVLILVKNQAAFDFFKQQFQDHTIKKKYIAIVFGWPKHERGIIDEPIGRSSANIRAWTTKSGARGTLRPAITRYVVQKKFEYLGASVEKYAIVDLYPQTGRTHQLRVHMKSLGHPLVADPLYAGNKSTSLPINRTALHAFEISFVLPSGESKQVQAPIPDDLAKIIKM